ncbi:MAG TPA: hypothetical protein VGJ60_20555 [Chloroflexota bacterium]|jgi:hypothetical protein
MTEEETTSTEDEGLVDTEGQPLAVEPSDEPQEVPEGGVPQETLPPPPIEAPPVPESLAEQVYRESHTVAESTGPSDIVPNRPNIRPPESVGAVEQPGPTAVTGEDLRAEEAEPVVTEEEPTTEPLA